MKNVLKWKNRNVLPFTIKIYRSTSPLDRANLTNPIATLTNGETTYEDDVTRGSINYYVIETTKGTDKASTQNIQIQALPRRGPGPLTLKQGDYNYGYFGSFPSREFMTTSQLMAALGVSLSGIAVLNQDSPLWHKWVRNGKILIVPNGPLTRQTHWKWAYDSGLVFGVDGPGPSNAGANVNQLKTVTFNGSTFKVRLMTCYDDNLSNVPPNTKDTEALYTFPNEFVDLVYPLVDWVPTMQRMANVQVSTRTQMAMTNTAGTGFICQERIANGNSYIAGANSESRSCVAQRDNSVINGTTTSNTFGWWPVLELIDG